MKKSAVAVAIVVAFGTIWTGSSWYTGKQLERRMGQEIDNLNKKLDQRFPNLGLKISYQDYQRHLFSTDVNYIVQAVPGLEKHDLKAGDSIILKEKISHGPFPLSQLKHFNFIPSLASVHSELKNTPAVKPLFDATKEKSPIDADTRIAYNGDSQSVIKLLPVDFHQDNSSIKFAGAKINADIQHDLRNILFKLDSQDITISGINKDNQQEQLSLKGLIINGESQHGQFDINIGKQQLSLNQLSVSLENKEFANLNGLTINVNIGESNNSLKGEIDYTLNDLTISKQSYGQGGMKMSFEGLDGEGVKKLSSQYNALINQQLKNNSLDINAMHWLALINDNLPELLKGNPTINLQPLSWKNSGGESKLSLALKLAIPENHDKNITLLRAIKMLDVKLDIPIAMAEQLTTQLAEQDGANADNAKEIAKQQVKNFIDTWKLFQLVKEKGNNITSEIHYINGVIDLNGNKIPLAQAEAILGLLSNLPGHFDEKIVNPDNDK